MLPGPRITEQRMRLALGILGATQLTIGLWLAIDPASFVDEVAAFGPADHHFLRDIATFQAGIGIALLAAAGRPSWRVPVLLPPSRRAVCTPSTTCSTSAAPTRAGRAR